MGLACYEAIDKVALTRLYCRCGKSLGAHMSEYNAELMPRLRHCGERTEVCLCENGERFSGFSQIFTDNEVAND